MIKNIIFDVGEVLMGYRWHDMLLDSGMTDAEANEIGPQLFSDSLWKGMDEGTISIPEAIEGFGKKFPNQADSIKWFISHGEYMNVPRPDVWKLVRQLKEKGYGIYLLSNYSEELFTKHTANADFMNVIDGRIVSYEVQLLKPDKKIYQALLNKYSLKANECIFFDDKIENVEAAIKEGIEAKQVSSKDHLIELLNNILAK